MLKIVKHVLMAAIVGAGESASGSVEAVTGNDAIDALMKDLNDKAPAPVQSGDVIEPSIESAQPQPGEVVEVVTPEAAKAAKKAAKDAAKKAAKEAAELKAAQKKAEREAAKLAKAEAKAKADAEAGVTPAPAKPKEKRIHFSNRADRMVHRMGDQLGDYMVLELADAALEGDALKAKQDETLTTIRAMNKKVQNRATLLIDFVAGKKESINNVIGVAFKVLHGQGKITTGDKGNIIGTLQGGGKGKLNTRPYSLNAARAMGNNTISLLKQLKVVVAGTEAGTFVANPNSLILAKVNAALKLS